MSILDASRTEPDEKLRALWFVRALAASLKSPSVWLLALGLAYTVILMRTGDAWWLGTVVLFAPRWPLAALAVPLTCWHFWRRSKWAFLDLAILAMVLGPIMGLRISYASGEVGTTVRVLTANIGGGGSAALVKEVIQRERPDVVALQECGENERFLIFDEDWQLSQTAGNLCIASRGTVDNESSLPGRAIGRWGTAGLKATVGTSAGQLQIVCLHLETPRWGLEKLALTRYGLVGKTDVEANTHRRRDEAIVLSKWCETPNVPTIVAGDFNTPVESQIYQARWGRYVNAFSVAGFGYGYTKWTSWHGVRIDHILCRGVSAVRAYVASGIGGDHRPVVADISIGRS